MKYEKVEVNGDKWLKITPLLNEKWKDIYNGRYQISNYGRVKSMFLNNRQVHYKREKILKSAIRNGYYCVTLYDGKKAKTYNIHRLVAYNFLDNPNNYKCVNHKDENKQNNRIDNLEFCTQKYNCNYGNRNKKISKNNTNRPKSKFEKIVQYDLQGNFIKEYENLCVAEKLTKIRHIRECCNNKRKTAKGYIFKYKKQIN